MTPFGKWVSEIYDEIIAKCPVCQWVSGESRLIYSIAFEFPEIDLNNFYVSVLTDVVVLSKPHIGVYLWF